MLDRCFILAFASLLWSFARPNLASQEHNIIVQQGLFHSTTSPVGLFHNTNPLIQNINYLPLYFRNCTISRRCNQLVHYNSRKIIGIKEIVISSSFFLISMSLVSIKITCLYSPVSIFSSSHVPRSYIPRYLCSPVQYFPVPLLPSFYVPLSLCSLVPMFPGPLFPGLYVPRFAKV